MIAQSPLVVHVVYRFSVGGLENGVVNLVNRLPATAWRHAIVALTEVADSFRARIQRDDVTYIPLRKPPGHAWRLYPTLFRLFRELRPSIVHTRNLAALEAVVPAWAAQVPVRIHGEHGRDMSDIDGSNPRYRLVRRVYRPFVHHYVAVSRDLETYLHTGVGVPVPRVTQIYNGVDTERFFPPSAGRLPIEGCPFTDPGAFLVGAVGRLEVVKDPLNLVRAFIGALAREPRARRSLRLVVVGDGPQRADAERLAHEAGIGDLVWFAGERPDVPGILRGLDCFALPSRAEGISNTLLEAMATGLPVVATRVGGNADLMVEGMTGLLVPPGDAGALGDAILGYSKDRATARRHGKAGRRHVTRQFSLDRMVGQYERLYLQLLGSSRRSRPASSSAPHGAARG